MSTLGEGKRADMRIITRKTLIATAVAATAVALTAAPASADSVTIQNGGYIEGTNVGDFLFLNNTSGSAVQCASLEATGYTPKDPATGEPIVDGPLLGAPFTFDNVALSSPGQVNDWCLANGFIPTQVTAMGVPWSFDLAGGHTGSGPGGTMDGRLNNVKVTLHAPSVPCDATVGGPGGAGGYVEGMYTNPSTLTGNDGTISLPFGSTNNLEVLSVSSVTDCAGLISFGEPFTLAGDIQVNRTGPVPPAAGISPTINF
ncbi:hypothetical protein [Actinomadura sp. GTD37]|uniref:hypothetical protein n=1 Tax=Actinomadura sp. GTD37 TaxID=1778030 RepID=UPI0035BFE1F1